MIKKLLKVLLIGGLFIPCFSFATYSPHSIGAYFGSDYQVSVLPQGTLSTIYGDTEKSVFSSIGNPVFYWDSESKAHLITPGFFDLPGDMGNYNFYRLCDEIPDSNFTDITNCSERVAYDDSFVSSFMSSIGSNDNWAFELYNGSNDYYHFNICFSSKSYHQSLCFFYRANQGYNGWGYQGDEFTCTSRECGTNPRYDFSSIPLEIIGNSPGFGGGKPSYEIGQNYYTNGQIVEGYEYLGLDIGYCYGGFPIDDIFEPNQTIEDFTGYKFGVGATVWDLYDLYSGAYSTPKQFFQQMLQAYMNGQINRFKTEPKALIMFVQQFVSGRDRGRLNVGFYDIWDYCNLKFDNVDLNAQYTGNNKTPINGYNQKKASDSNLGGFQFTGDNAFNIIVGTGGSGNISASEFFGNLTSRFQNGLGTVNSTYESMIPTYILMFMFALIFIRLISH